MLKFLLIIIIHSYKSHDIVLEKFKTKEQCETAILEIEELNNRTDSYRNIYFNSKCVKIEI